MSLLKEKFNLCVIDIKEDISITQGEAFLALQKFPFTEVNPSDEFGHGFVDIQDIFNTDFSMEDSVVVNSVIGGYRYDKKAVPGILLKKLFRERLRKEEEAEGCRFDKDQKKILKEDCKKTLLVKTLAKPNLVSWVWDMDNSRVLIDSKSKTVIANFIDLFKQTFQIQEMNVVNFGLTEKEQVGDFLEWLWRGTDEMENVWLDTGVTFDLDKNTFKFQGPDIETFTEDIESFKKSKSVKGIGLGVEIDENEYGVTLNHSNMILSVERKDGIQHSEAETAVLDNMDHIDKLLHLTSDLVKKYMVWSQANTLEEKPTESQDEQLSE